MYPKYIVESMASPIFIAIKVDCYVHTKPIIYPPFPSILIIPSDVSQPMNVAHNIIYYHMYHRGRVLQERVVDLHICVRVGGR